MPTIVKSFWLGNRLPLLQVLSLQSFIAHGHEYHLYVYDPIENAPEGVVLRDASKILPRQSVFTYQKGFGKGSYSAFSNLFRYKLLLEHGGWWVDTDVVCLRPFVFDDDYVFATERHPDGTTATASCVFKAPAGAAVLRHCLGVCESVDIASLMWAEIGPQLLHDAVLRFDLARYCVSPRAFTPIDYAAFRDVIAPGFDMARLGDAHAVHLWNQMWVSYYIDRDYLQAPDSLFAQLCRRYLPPPCANDDVSAARRHIAFQRAAIDQLVSARDEAESALARTDQALREAQHALAESHEQVRARTEELAARSEELRARHGELQRMHYTLAVVRGQLEALRNSRSWRATAPLRRAFDALTALAQFVRRRR